MSSDRFVCYDFRIMDMRSPNRTTDLEENGTSEPTRFKRGLVLQGGGAKGAFQFGVLSELHRCGIQFDVVAGTSVGALNGALVATNSWDIGEQLWGNMALENVFDWTGLKAVIALLLLPSILYHGWIRGEISPLLPKFVIYFSSFLFFAPFFLLYVAWVVPFYADESNGIIFRSFVAGLVALLLLGSYLGESKNSSPIRQTFGIFAPLQIWGCFWILKGFEAWKQEYIRADLQEIAIILSCISAATLAIGVLLKFYEISIFSNQPLKDLIEKVVDREFVIPLVATAAEVCDFFDPDDYYYTGGTNGRGDMPTEAKPVKRTAYRASYLRIDEIPRYEVVDSLATSAALPLGVVPNSNVFGVEGTYVDGGVVDNTPWFPLIDEYPCDEIVIVLCSPIEADLDIPSRDEWKRRDRDIRKLKNNFYPPFAMGEQTRKINRPPSVIPFRLPQLWPTKGDAAFKILAPSSSLGGFVSATLNFSAEKSQKNYQEGIITARLAIESGMFGKHHAETIKA